MFIVKGEKGLSALQVDLAARQVTKANLAANDECSNVFADCLHVERQPGQVRVLATSNVEVEDNLFKRRVLKLNIPLSL